MRNKRPKRSFRKNQMQKFRRRRHVQEKIQAFATKEGGNTEPGEPRRALANVSRVGKPGTRDRKNWPKKDLHAHAKSGQGGVN